MEPAVENSDFVDSDDSPTPNNRTHGSQSN